MNNPQEPTHVVIHRVPQDPRAYRALTVASWSLIILTCGLSLIPFLGFASWLIAIPVFLATFIMAIITLTRGGTLQGILLLLTSVFFGPVMVACAPFVTSALGMGGVLAAGAAREAAVTQERTSALIGRWRRDDRVLIDYLPDGTFKLPPRNGQSAVTGQWQVAGDTLTWTTTDQSQAETIASLSSTRLVTRDASGEQHTYTKEARP